VFETILHWDLLKRLAALALLVGLPVAKLACQSTPSPQLLASYIGQNVSGVEIAGQPNITYEGLRDSIAVTSGKTLTQPDINSSVQALKQASGASDVTLDIQPEANGVRVVFVLHPAIYIGMYQFPGATRQYAYSRLLMVSNYTAQSPYANADLRRGEDALVRLFRQDGFFEAEVHAETVVDSAHSLANVLFNTSLGRRARIGEVNLQGATPEESAYLKGKLKSVMARLRTSALKPGMTFSRYRLQNATQYMLGALAKQNYLAGTVELVSAEYDQSSNRADVTFHVQTGPVVKLKATGAHIWGRTFKNLVPVYAAQSADTDLVNEGGRNIQLYFQKKGYFDAQVVTNVQNTGQGKLITYEIKKGERHKVEDIAFNGNQNLTDKELRSHIPVQPARLFSHGKFSDTLLRTSVKNLENTYRSAGYGNAAVVPHVRRQGGNIAVSFDVTEGPLDLVQDLQIVGNHTLPESELAPKGLQLGPGKPYSQALVSQDRNQIIARYLTLGYLNPSFQSTSTPIQGSPHRLAVVYQITEGPQVKVADIVTLGRQHTRPELIDRQIPFHTADPLSENEMMRSETELYNQGIFDWAEVDPKIPIADSTHTADVIVKVHEAKRNSIVYGFGFEVINRGGSVPSGTVLVPGIPPVGLPDTFKTSQQTFWGPRGTFEYTRRNLRGKAESATVSAYAGRLDQRLGFTYTNPYLRNTKWKASGLLSAEHNETNPIFSARLANIGYQIERSLNEKKTANFFLRYNFGITRVSHLLIPELVPPDQLNVRLSTLSASYIRDTRDNILDAHRGWYQSAEIDVNPVWLGSNFSFVKFLAQVANYKNIGAGIIWANSVRLGLEAAYAGSVVPVSQKFFTGGGSTLRGFPLNGAGPQQSIPACGIPTDPSTCVQITVPQGGNELFIVNSELRFPLDPIKKGLGIVAFYDGGNVFPSVGFHDFTSLYTNSVGLGLRYVTPVGPVRIDLGHNLNPVPGIKSTQYFITIGQAF
jgi:outer membrane protein assembly factor BamA